MPPPPVADEGPLEWRLTWLFRFGCPDPAATDAAPASPAFAEATALREEVAARRDRLTGSLADRVAGLEAILADVGRLEVAECKIACLAATRGTPNG